MTEKLSVKVGGEEKELFMSYGLLNELTKIVGSPEVAPSITINEGLREDVLKAVLADRKPSGKILKAVEDIDDVEISIDDVEKVLDWATAAVMSFFVRSLGKMVSLVDQNKDVVAGLKSSLDGLQDSASAKA